MAPNNLNQQEALIVSIVEDAGGEASHRDIAEALETLQQSSVIVFIFGLVAKGELSAVVRAAPSARARLMYSLPAGQGRQSSNPTEATTTDEEVK